MEISKAAEAALQEVSGAKAAVEALDAARRNLLRTFQLFQSRASLLERSAVRPRYKSARMPVWGSNAACSWLSNGFRRQNSSRAGLIAGLDNISLCVPSCKLLKHLTGRVVLALRPVHVKAVVVDPAKHDCHKANRMGFKFEQTTAAYNAKTASKEMAQGSTGALAFLLESQARVAKLEGVDFGALQASETLCYSSLASH